MSLPAYVNNVLRSILPWCLRGAVFLLVLQEGLLKAASVTVTHTVVLDGSPGGCNGYILGRRASGCTTFLGIVSDRSVSDVANGTYTFSTTVNEGDLLNVSINAAGSCSDATTACQVVPTGGGAMFWTITQNAGLLQPQVPPAPNRWVKVTVKNNTITERVWNVRNAAGTIVGTITIPPGGTSEFLYNSPIGAQNMTVETVAPNGELVVSEIGSGASAWSTTSSPGDSHHIDDSLGIVVGIAPPEVVDFPPVTLGSPLTEGTFQVGANGIATLIQQGDAILSAKLSGIQSTVSVGNSKLDVIAGNTAGTAAAAATTANNTSAANSKLDTIAVNTGNTAGNTAGLGAKLDSLAGVLVGVDPRPNIDALPESMKAKGIEAAEAAGPYDSATSSLQATATAAVGVSALSGVVVPYAAPAKPAGGSWAVTIRGQSVDFNPMAHAWFVDTAALSWKILLWFCTATYALLAWKTISQTVRDASQVPQAVTAGTTVLGTNVNSLGAVAMAVIIVGAIAAIPVVGVVLFANAVNIGPLAVDPLSGFSGGVVMGINLAFEFIPIGQICTLAGAYFALQVSCDILFMGAVAFVKFAVGS